MHETRDIMRFILLFDIFIQMNLWTCLNPCLEILVLELLASVSFPQVGGKHNFSARIFFEYLLFSTLEQATNNDS